jgi:hypothetical protein
VVIAPGSSRNTSPPAEEAGPPEIKAAGGAVSKKRHPETLMRYLDNLRLRGAVEVMMQGPQGTVTEKSLEL